MPNHVFTTKLQEATRELVEANRRCRGHADERRRRMQARGETVRVLLAAEDAEAGRIARMLHDTMGQNIAAVLLGLKAIARDPAVSDGTRLPLESLQAIAQGMGQELHRISVELRPTSLEDHGLVNALRTFFEDWALVHRTPVKFDAVGLLETRLPSHLEATCYRILRELLGVVSRAAGTERIEVILQLRQGCVVVVVEATGSRVMSGSAGLAAVEARVVLLDGDLQIESRPEGGTTFIVRLPGEVGVNCHD